MSEQYDPLAAYLAKGTLEQIREIFNEWLEFQKKLSEYESQNENKTGEIRQKDLIKGLSISKTTLKTWHSNGLTPIYRGGSVFYLLEELHQFNY